MLYIALGVGLLILFLGLGRTKALLKHAQWRIASAVFGLMAFTLAAYFGARGIWAPAVVFMVLGLWLSASARTPREARGAKPQQTEAMSAEEAYAILDLKPGASREEINAAYKRLMKLVHPDSGGGAGLASKLNAARDRLLKK